MKTKILLVDDERDIVEFLQYNLVQEGFDVVIAYDGKEALSKLSEKPDLIILDIMMPIFDGYEVCKKVRATKGFEKTPVVFLTAKAGEYDEILGLELGASDYITKPISPKKLIARVKSNLRKTGNQDGKPANEKISAGPLTIDRELYTIYLRGKKVFFPRKEFEVLFYLASSPGKVFSREILLKDVWGSDVFVVDRTIDVHIRKIREKLDKDSDLIETIKGIGYRFKSVE